MVARDRGSDESPTFRQRIVGCGTASAAHSNTALAPSKAITSAGNLVMTGGSRDRIFVHDETDRKCHMNFHCIGTNGYTMQSNQNCACPLLFFRQEALRAQRFN